ncbi:MAG TPA: hypothetical protein PLL75_00605 [Candidatus Omnitrophota bacterium]|nr:hypothetical protein [Candidatus Omnitrophota bacterium]HPS36215.1 hypothetical protein [Candidatus Omnitrophota bacterium]
MIYFKILSIMFGAGMVAGGLWIVLGAAWWKSVFPKLYPEKKPAWVLLSMAATLALVAWTWGEFLTHPSAYAFVVTAVVSLALLKVLLLSFFYPKCREIVSGLLAEPLALRVVMLSSAAVGAALLFLGLFF